MDSSDQYLPGLILPSSSALWDVSPCEPVVCVQYEGAYYTTGMVWIWDITRLVWKRCETLNTTLI